MEFPQTLNNLETIERKYTNEELGILVANAKVRHLCFFYLMLSICFCYYSLIAFIRFPFKPLGSSMVVPDEVWNFLIRQHLQQLEGPMSDCVHSVNKLMVEAFEEVEKVKLIFLCSKTSVSACLANIEENLWKTIFRKLLILQFMTWLILIEISSQPSQPHFALKNQQRTSTLTCPLFDERLFTERRFVKLPIGRNICVQTIF